VTAPIAARRACSASQFLRFKGTAPSKRGELNIVLSGGINHRLPPPSAHRGMSVHLIMAVIGRGLRMRFEQCAQGDTWQPITLFFDIGEVGQGRSFGVLWRRDMLK
jgi:hypothetical protein